MANRVSFDFSGKTALVTGGSRGIGRAICIALTEAGAKTFALARTQKHLDDLVAQYPSIHPVCVDLSNWEETRKAVEKIGPVDLLVNNAAVGIMVPFLDAKEEEIDKLLSVNLKAAYNVSQVVAQGMIERKCSGSIVNISGQASIKTIDRFSIMAPSKAALDALTRSMALELGRHQIRTNSVLPTGVMTDLGKMAFSDEAIGGPLRAMIPLGRFAEVSEVVEPVLFLLSEGSSMVNGAFVTIDGGATVW